MSFVILNCSNITRRPISRPAANDNMEKANEK
jgi:hypothetical protein